MCFTLSYLQHNWWRSKQGSSSLEGCRWWVRGIGFEAQTLRSVRSCLLYRKRQNKFGCRPESGLHPSPPLCPPPQRLRLGSYIFDPHEWWSHTEKKKHRSFNRRFPTVEKRKEKGSVKSDTLLLFASWSQNFQHNLTKLRKYSAHIIKNDLFITLLLLNAFIKKSNHSVLPRQWSKSAWRGQFCCIRKFTFFFFFKGGKCFILQPTIQL